MSNKNFHSELHKMVQNPEYQEGAIKVHFLSEDQKVLGYVYMHKCHIRELDKEYYDVYCNGKFGDDKFGFTLLESENVECFTEYLEDFMVYKDTSNNVKINLTDKSLKKYIVSTRFNHNFYNFDMNNNSDILLLNELPPLIYEEIMKKYSDNVYAILNGLSNEIKMKWLEEKNFSLDEIIKFLEPEKVNASHFWNYPGYLREVFQKANEIEQNFSNKMDLCKLLENKISPESKLIIDDYLKKYYLDAVYFVNARYFKELNQLQQQLIKYFKIEKNAYCMKVLIIGPRERRISTSDLLNKKIFFIYDSNNSTREEDFDSKKTVNIISVWNACELQSNKIKVEVNVYFANRISINDIWHKKYNDNPIITTTQICKRSLIDLDYVGLIDKSRHFYDFYPDQDEQEEEQEEEQNYE